MRLLFLLKKYFRFLKQTFSERLAEKLHVFDRMVWNILREMTGGVAEYQPEKNDGEYDVEQQGDLNDRIDQIGAQKGVHARKLTLLQPRIAQDVPRGGDKEPHAEDAEQHKAQAAGTDQHREIAVVKIHQKRRQITVMVGELYAVLKHLPAVIINVALADAEHRMLGNHLQALLPEHQPAGVHIGVFMVKGDRMLLLSGSIHGRHDPLIGLDELGKAELTDRPQQKHGGHDHQSRKSTRKRTHQYLLKVEIALRSEHFVDDEKERVADQHHQRAVGIAEQQRDAVDRHAAGKPNAADAAAACQDHKIPFEHHVTAKHSDHSRKRHLVGVHKQTGKAVFIDDELDAQKFKINAEHQQRQSCRAEHGGEIDDDAADIEQLVPKIELLFGVHRIKNEEANGNVQQERKIQKSIVEHMQQQCHCRRHKKRYQPKAVARAQRGAACDLGIDDQKRAPNHHEHQHGIGGKMHVGNIAGEEANDIALPEQRFAQKRLFQICHTLSYLRFP